MTKRQRRARQLAILLAAFSCAAAIACAEPQGALPLRAEPVRPPATGVARDARSEVRAPIARVSVRVAESFPPQYFADVTSALPDGCARFSRAELRRAGETLFIDVFNTHPARDDMVCSMIYGEQESAIALGSDFEPGKTYTLDVNGTREQFTAQ